jgi:chemotaxis-related protein WspD
MDSHEPNPGAAGNPAPAQALQTLSSGDVAVEAIDCWNRIGVSGDSSCSRLAEVLHCRNCPVYSTAASHLLDRQLPADYRRQWTEHFSVEKKSAAAGRHSLVVFRVGREWLALPTRVFRQIAEHRKVHSLPHSRDKVLLGVANVRGALLVCVSLGRLLGLEQAPSLAKPRTVYERLIVAEWEGKPLVFPADEVHGIYRHRPEELRDPPATVAKAAGNFIKGLLPWEGRLVALLDEELLFSTLNRSLA